MAGKGDTAKNAGIDALRQELAAMRAELAKMQAKPVAQGLRGPQQSRAEITAFLQKPPDPNVFYSSGPWLRICPIPETDEMDTATRTFKKVPGVRFELSEWYGPGCDVKDPDGNKLFLGGVCRGDLKNEDGVGLGGRHTLEEVRRILVGDDEREPFPGFAPGAPLGARVWTEEDYQAYVEPLCRILFNQLDAKARIKEQMRARPKGAEKSGRLADEPEAEVNAPAIVGAEKDGRVTIHA